MAASKRVVKPRKQDDLLDHGMTRDIKDARIQSALWDYDRAISDAEQTWGVDRLPYLVGDEIRKKWWRNVDTLNDAVRARDDETVQRLVPNMIKGIGVMIQKAIEIGEKPLEANILETPMKDGKILRVVKAWPENSYRQRKNERDVVTYSIEEVARMLEKNSLVVATKVAFPGATITKVRTPSEELIDDEIPF